MVTLCMITFLIDSFQQVALFTGEYQLPPQLYNLSTGQRFEVSSSPDSVLSEAGQPATLFLISE